MEEIAWRLRTLNPSRQIGFVSAAPFHQIQEDAVECADASSDRDNLSIDRD
jgi:hypothetical protein